MRPSKATGAAGARKARESKAREPGDSAAAESPTGTRHPEEGLMNDATPLQPIPLRRLAPYAVPALLLLLLLWVVSFDQGAVSRTGELVHELMHDGRHLLGVPCH
jgi:hypothetical protein